MCEKCSKGSKNSRFLSNFEFQTGSNSCLRRFIQFPFEGISILLQKYCENRYFLFVPKYGRKSRHKSVKNELKPLKTRDFCILLYSSWDQLGDKNAYLLFCTRSVQKTQIFRLQKGVPGGIWGGVGETLTMVHPQICKGLIHKNLGPH